MNNKIYPCIWFDGKAKEAAQFYCSIFNNGTIKQENALVALFEISGKQFMGLNGGPKFSPNPSISFFVKCVSIEETNDIYAKLIDGGSALIGIDKHPWSERYGWVKDKFGVTWQVMVDPGPNPVQSICPSFLFTQEKFGKAEEAVKLYTSLFKNSTIDVLSHYPEGDANAGKVLFSEFKLDGNTMIAMDGPGNHGFVFDEGISLVVSCETQEEIDYFWEHFISGGGEESRCGWLKDKFGVSWQIIPANIGKLVVGPHAEKVMQVVMQMKKIILADMEKAAQG